MRNQLREFVFQYRNRLSGVDIGIEDNVDRRENRIRARVITAAHRCQKRIPVALLQPTGCQDIRHIGRDLCFDDHRFRDQQIHNRRLIDLGAAPRTHRTGVRETDIPCKQTL